jgi:prevent-host-death family protein
LGQGDATCLKLVCGHQAVGFKAVRQHAHSKTPARRHGRQTRFWLDRPEPSARVAGVKSVWQLQEAKNQLSLVVEQALKNGTQTITRHGRPVVMVVAADTYGQLKPRRKIVDILRSCPGGGLELSPVKDLPPEVKL